MTEQTAPHEGTNTQNNADCITEVHSRSLASKSLWGEERKPRTIRIADNIYFPFKLRTKQLGSSVCSEVETFMVSYLSASKAIVEGKVHLGTTINLDQTVYRQLGRDRRRVNPEAVTERDINDKEIGSLRDVAQPFINYYLGHPDLDPSAQTLYKNFVREGLELDWEVKQDLASLILRRLKESRIREVSR